MSTERLSCVISGSFKFKPEIDGLYDELTENGIDVLAPDKGWLYVPYLDVRRTGEYANFRPLPTERGMSPRQVEDEFLRHLARASFVYLNNAEGYIGLMSAFEMGNALEQRKPIYAKEPLDFIKSGFEDLAQWMLLKSYIRVIPIPEIVEDFHKMQQVA